MDQEPIDRIVGPTAFVSYAQSQADWSADETKEWKATVLRFAMLLCEMGIDTEVDQFYAHDVEVDWNRFGPTMTREKDFVLIAISRAYRERWEGTNTPNEGAGAVRESNELMGQFNQDQTTFRRRVKVVVLPGASRNDVPAELSNLQRFEVFELSPGAVTDLYRTLTNQPATPKPPIGPLRTFDSAEPVASNKDQLEQLHADLEVIQAALDQMPALDRAQAERGNFSLPWVRSAYQMMGQEQAILTRIADLSGSSPASLSTVPGDDGLARVVSESFAAAGYSAAKDVVFELGRRLSDPETGPEELLRLFQGLPGRTIDISVQKRVKYDLHRQGILARNPAGRGYVIGSLP